MRLELELPDSPANTAVGVFQVTAELLSADGRRAALETMPAAVPYTPPTSRLLRTLRSVFGMRNFRPGQERAAPPAPPPPTRPGVDLPYGY